jgi:hypothetical protein
MTTVILSKMDVLANTAEKIEICTKCSSAKEWYRCTSIPNMMFVLIVQCKYEDIFQKEWLQRQTNRMQKHQFATSHFTFSKNRLPRAVLSCFVVTLSF